MRDKLKELNPEAFEILCKTYAGELETDSEILQDNHSRKYAHLRIAAAWNLFVGLNSAETKRALMIKIGVYLAMFVGREQPYAYGSINQNIDKHKAWSLVNSDESEAYRAIFGTEPPGVIEDNSAGAYVFGCQTAIDTDYQINMYIEKANMLEVYADEFKRKYDEAMVHATEAKLVVQKLKALYETQLERNFNILAAPDKKATFNNEVQRWRQTR